jgi:hypothetical protein
LNFKGGKFCKSVSPEAAEVVDKLADGGRTCTPEETGSVKKFENTFRQAGEISKFKKCRENNQAPREKGSPK